MYKATTKNQIFVVSLAKIHLWIVLILFFTLSLPFLLSNLDLEFSTKFYNFTTKTWENNSTLHWIYTLGPLMQVLCFNFAFVYWILSYLKSQWIQFRTRSIFIILTILVSEFLVEFLKHIFLRPRPRNIEFFGGETLFAPLWSIGEGGLSFPSSHAKSGFILIFLFYLSYPNHKKRSFLFLVLSLILGFALSYTRIAQGGHFLSDCLFALILAHGTSAIFALILGSKKNIQPPQEIHPSIEKFFFLYFIIILVPVLSITLYIIRFFLQ